MLQIVTHVLLVLLYGLFLDQHTLLTSPDNVLDAVGDVIDFTLNYTEI